MKKVESLRKKMSFIIGINELNNDEIEILDKKIKLLIGSNYEQNKKKVIIAFKDSIKYELNKQIYICCGCAEFKIPIKRYYLFLAIDY